MGRPYTRLIGVSLPAGQRSWPRCERSGEMSAAAGRFEDGFSGRQVVAGLGQAADAARRPGFLVAGASGQECNCPDDCERDHANE